MRPPSRLLLPACLLLTASARPNTPYHHPLDSPRPLCAANGPLSQSGSRDTYTTTPAVRTHSLPPPRLHYRCRTTRSPTRPRPRHATRQRRARGSERIPRLLAGNLGVARSYSLTHTRTAALVCACASSHGAASAEHVRYTLDRETGHVRLAIGCDVACVLGAIRARTPLSVKPDSCCSTCESYMLRVH